MRRSGRTHRWDPLGGVVLALAVLACTAGAGAGASSRSVRGLPLLPSVSAASKFEGDFESRLAASDPGRRQVALIDLTDQLDLRELGRRLDRAGQGKRARRDAVVSALEQVARRQQAKLAPTISALTSDGSLGFAKGVAIVNRLVVEGTPQAIRTLARCPEVRSVRPDWSSERAPVGKGDAEADATLGATFPSWAPASMHADTLWSRGYDGQGVVVAIIDTGAFESHEQLTGRRVPGDAGWFDPVEGTTIGTDHHGHGTGVLSQAVGGNPEGRIVGVAPKARWAAAVGNWRNYYVRSRMTLAADWALRVARPDVLVNAWSHDEGPCSEFDRPFIDAWKASGIFVVFPAGNGGPAAGTGESPAQLPGVLAVAALGRDGLVDALSSRGPSRCGSPGFPSFAAPGRDLPMALASGPRAYAMGEGTSLSAGLLGGAAALLLQAAPETDPDTLERVLVRTSRDLGPPGRDDDTGAGAIDLEAALAALEERRP
ncbi:MAG TPA: S8 family serine peptidase [Candidatus Polarisedimenticolaceae bacterium]|nr:S8 family serine peptidase [Candidatus Polarisedimenticolaceae bacterium]